MNFADAVGRTPEIAECLKNGLQALKRQDRNQSKDTTASRDLKGSVDIDACLERALSELNLDGITGSVIRIKFTTLKSIRREALVK